VIEVGSKVSMYKVGDEVMLGLSPNAAAEQIIVNERQVLPKPKVWSHAEAAAFPVGFITSYHALVHRGKLAAGEFLLVTGAAGGMGMSCVQLGRKLGAIVIACASSPEKLQQCTAAGAHHVIDYTRESLKDSVNEITKGKWVDVCYEVVGGQIFDQCSRLMAPGGRLLVVGFTSGTIPKFPVNLALVKGFSVVGVRSGAELSRQPEMGLELLQQLVAFTTPSATTSVEEARSLAPVILPQYCYPSDRYQDAFSAVAERRIIGKSIILWKPDATSRPGASASSSIRSSL